MDRSDEVLLSRYLDGELAPFEAERITASLEKDDTRRDNLLRLVAIQAELKAMGNGIREEDVPERLLHTVRQHGRDRKTFWYSGILQTTPLRYAAMLVLFITSFFVGSQWSASPDKPMFFPVMPAELERVVNDTLEFSPSGKGTMWTDDARGLQANIEPLRTFRGKNGGYYRLYIVELTEGGAHLPYVGLAMRTGSKHWQTRSFYLQDGELQI